MTDPLQSKRPEHAARVSTDPAGAAQAPACHASRGSAAANFAGLADLHPRKARAEAQVELARPRVMLIVGCSWSMRPPADQLTSLGNPAAGPGPAPSLPTSPPPPSLPPPPPSAAVDAAVGGAPGDWGSKNAATQASLAELSQKAAIDSALLKLRNDLNDSTVSFMKKIGSSVKAAAQ